jgi:hypothetical protein
MTPQEDPNARPAATDQATGDDPVVPPPPDLPPGDYVRELQQEFEEQEEERKLRL